MSRWLALKGRLAFPDTGFAVGTTRSSRPRMRGLYVATKEQLRLLRWLRRVSGDIGAGDLPSWLYGSAGWLPAVGDHVGTRFTAWQRKERTRNRPLATVTSAHVLCVNPSLDRPTLTGSSLPIPPAQSHAQVWCMSDCWSSGDPAVVQLRFNAVDECNPVDHVGNLAEPPDTRRGAAPPARPLPGGSPPRSSSGVLCRLSCRSWSAGTCTVSAEMRPGSRT